MEDITSMITQIDTMKGQPNRTLVISLLKALRKSKIRRPDIVIKFGWQLIQSGLRGNEIWTLYEQVFNAALDTGNMDLADNCLHQLLSQFPKSSRVKLLVGMKNEAEENWVSALTLYDELITLNPANLIAMKRKVCVYKAQGNIKEMIEHLNLILGVFQSDITSWLELAETYASLCDYQSSAYCYEEVILILPTNTSYHTRLAEVYYTQGGQDGYMKARRHYTIAINLEGIQKCSLRTLYGIVSTCKALRTIKKHQSSQEGSVSEALLKTALAEITERSQSGSQSASSISVVLNTLNYDIA